MVVFYKGGFKDEELHGTGKLFMADGNTYEGGFKNGTPYEKAKLTVNNIKTKEPIYIFNYIMIME